MKSTQIRALFLTAFTLGLVVAVGDSTEAIAHGIRPVSAVSDADFQVLAQRPFPDGPSRSSRRGRNDFEDRLEDRLENRREDEIRDRLEDRFDGYDRRGPIRSSRRGRDDFEDRLADRLEDRREDEIRDRLEDRFDDYDRRGPSRLRR